MKRLPEADAFTNGYRYLNWLIDVPMLLFQILFVVTLTSARRGSYRNGFFISGPLMIITGYIGQFYETTNMTAFLRLGRYEYPILLPCSLFDVPDHSGRQE